MTQKLQASRTRSHDPATVKLDPTSRLDFGHLRSTDQWRLIPLGGVVQAVTSDHPIDSGTTSRSLCNSASFLAISGDSSGGAACMLYGGWSTRRALHVYASSASIRLGFGEIVFWVLRIFTVIAVSGSNSGLLTLFR
ncbi:hypothetical protein RchiOBHm_Chr2g0141761 [Rosa chinensis]|uniref:Uncharacterized protein n=1 Tax=Rosa chinensis TaxID=74649 RepID=A0A2P6RXP4_ROSCH|nr:hypothetical protein RchiOBHm_Chr2g0141761 [Rosa chinensis]